LSPCRLIVNRAPSEILFHDQNVSAAVSTAPFESAGETCANRCGQGVRH
jgi:hypothetical protein